MADSTIKKSGIKDGDISWGVIHNLYNGYNGNHGN
jgi:hypothetical protein